jgi:geranyl-CoA carboxylase alpha subunit
LFAIAFRQAQRERTYSEILKNKKMAAQRIRSLLIANRGEIVLRIARTARRMGIRTIAVYSDADAGAPHTTGCDAAMPIGGERPADSYLRIDKILQAAKASGADAIHPGYGFLSENAAFAQAVVDAGLVWIGPPAQAIAAMGDKARARQRMAAAGVPVLPGYDDEDQTHAVLIDAAKKIGFPVMVKASGGGGGRGMRRADRSEDLAAALQSAASEAQAAFGDARLILERALRAPRHVEVQVFADAQGKVVHLGERDCSVQRRHQKIIEEAPSPAVSPALRRQMGVVAVQVAQNVGYTGAGTVEFLLDADGTFYFMEMNTRLQVEHPVTEALTGIDLVQWQLDVAQGKPLPLTQAQILERFETGGHAIEVRLCSEDPAQDYLPQSGSIVCWQAPESVRCDHALEQRAGGQLISPFYDSMLAKLIAHAGDRSAAIMQLSDALDRTVCLGTTTNRAFLARALRHAAFGNGDVTTAFLPSHFPANADRTAEAPSGLPALAAACLARLPDRPLASEWLGWQSSGVLHTSVPLLLNGQTQTWHVAGDQTSLQARRGDIVHEVSGLKRDQFQILGLDTVRHSISATIDGAPLQAVWVQQGALAWLQAGGIEICVEDRRLAAARGRAKKSSGAVLAPMHGRVVQVHTQQGATVAVGALLMVIEAMKMEHQILAPLAGTVTELHAVAGDQVAARRLLLVLAP